MCGIKQEKVKNMENNLIIFDSITPVMKSRDLLKNHRISSRSVRTPAKLRKKSCGYSLYVKNDFSDALKIIKDNNVRYIGTSAVDYI